MNVASALPDRSYLRDALKHEQVRRLLDGAKKSTTAHAGGRVCWHEWGNGPPVVLLHGGFGSWLHWVRNVGALAEHYHVMAADLPGLGESDPVAIEKPTANDIAMPIVEGIREKIGEAVPVNLVCFSLGAVIGGQVACALQHQLRKAVLIGPSGLGDLWRNVTGELMRRHPDMTAAERRETIRHNLLHSMIADPASIDDMALDLQSDLLRQKRQLIGLPLSLSDSLTRALPQLADRLSIIWGDRDCYPSPDVATAARILHQRLPSIDIHILPGIGHWAAFEAAKQINEMLLALLAAPNSASKES